MVTWFSNLWSYVNPTEDPSHAHFENLVREEDEALQRNQQLVEEQVALQRQLGDCLDKIIKQSPQLAQWMEEMREAPLDKKEMNFTEKTQLMATLSEVVAFLQSNQELTAYKAQLNALLSQNGETEAEIDSLEKELGRLDHLIKQFEEDVRRREANLSTLMLQRRELQKM